MGTISTALCSHLYQFVPNGVNTLMSFSNPIHIIRLKFFRNSRGPPSQLLLIAAKFLEIIFVRRLCWF